MQPLIQKVSRFLYNRPIGLLIIRIAVGAIFLSHGLGKISDTSGTIAYFDTLGFSPLIAFFIAWLEVLGGLSLILGVAPRVFAALLGAEMFIATLIIQSTGGLGELEFLLAAAAFGIMFLGSGKYALYKMECNTCNGLLCIKKNRVCVMQA